MFLSFNHFQVAFTAPPLLVTIVCLALACNSADAPKPHAPASVVLVSGDVQSAEAGTELPAPLVVKVVDSSGSPVQGQLVSFVVTAGHGSVFAGAALTNAAGLAQERWTLGPSAADSQRLEARAVDNTTGARVVFAVFRAIALALPPALLRPASGQALLGYAGLALRVKPTVLVLDRLGLPVRNARVTFQITGGAGSVSSDSARSDSVGVAVGPVWTLGPGSGANSLNASTPGTSLLTFTASPITFDGITVSSHSCALTTQHVALCWGRNLDGEVGSGNANEQLVPVPVVTTSSYASLAAGSAYTCALDLTQNASCWGANQVAQLGDGSTQGHTLPTPVAGMHAFVSIVSDESTTCALDAVGNGYCWGYNDFGQVGDGTTTSRVLPTPVAGGLHFSQIASGRGQACGLTASGQAYCWGRDADGELGIGDTATLNPPAPRPLPTPVAGGFTFTSIVAGSQATCGIATGDVAYCWGYNGTGQLGDSTRFNHRISPTRVAGGLHFSSLSLGTNSGCGLAAGGVAYCWGLNSHGEVGDGSLIQRLVPTRVAGNLVFAVVAVGDETVCGVTSAGQVYCWGENDLGQVGDGTTEDRVTPILVRP